MGDYLQGFVISTVIFVFTQGIKWILRKTITVPKVHGFKKKSSRFFNQ